MKARIQKFLSTTVQDHEFSHTIIHGKPKPGHLVVQAAVNLPPSAFPDQMKAAMKGMPVAPGLVEGPRAVAPMPTSASPQRAPNGVVALRDPQRPQPPAAVRPPVVVGRMPSPPLSSNKAPPLPLRPGSANRGPPVPTPTPYRAAVNKASPPPAPSRPSSAVAEVNDAFLVSSYLTYDT